jgi:hypothetical protein
MSVSRRVILGSSGFVGAELQKEFPDAVKINRRNIDEILKEGIPDKELIVINCISNAKGNSEASIHRDNFSIPLEIANKLDIAKWIQLSSYYSEFKIINGVEFNSYSKSKDLFSSYLASNSGFQTLDLVLPHIYWPTEKRERFLSACYLASLEKTELTIASLDQVVPILSRKKAIYQIKEALTSNHNENYIRTKVESETNAHIREIEYVLTEITGNSPRFKESLKPEGKYFHDIDWPSTAVNRTSRLEVLFNLFSLYASSKKNS